MAAGWAIVSYSLERLLQHRGPAGGITLIVFPSLRTSCGGTSWRRALSVTGAVSRRQWSGRKPPHSFASRAGIETPPELAIRFHGKPLPLSRGGVKLLTARCTATAQ